MFSIFAGIELIFNWLLSVREGKFSPHNKQNLQNISYFLHAILKLFSHQRGEVIRRADVRNVSFLNSVRNNLQFQLS